MKIRFFAVPVLLSSLLLISCGDNHNDEKNKEVDDLMNDSTSIVIDSSSVTDEEHEISYNLPSALHIAHVFKKSGSTFVPSLLNNAGNTNKYNTSNYKRATNFGVYSSDLAYCIFNKQYQESKQYLKACKDVGAFLGLNRAFDGDERMVERFDKNITNEDTLVMIVSNIQLKTDIMFEQNKQKHITAVAFAGAWSESTYLAAEVYAKDKNKKVLANLLEQLMLSETIIKALKHYAKAEPEMPQLIAMIEKINTDFNGIASVKSAIEKDEEIDFEKLKVTDAELKMVTESIKALRKNIVE